MTLELLNDDYTIYKFKPEYIVNKNISSEEFFSATKTKDELSIVARENLFNDFINAETGWKILKISGTLDFNLVGILSRISAVLAGTHISVFVVSTFNTDYIMVKKEKIKDAVNVLVDNGYEVKADGSY